MALRDPILRGWDALRAMCARTREESATLLRKEFTRQVLYWELGFELV